MIHHTDTQPRAVVISGPAGAGKTTLGQALAPRLGYAIVDLDTVTGPLASFALEQLGVTEDFDLPSGRRLRGLRYAALLDVARANLDVGLGVVLTAPFTRERREQAAWSAVEARLGVGAALLYLDAPADILLDRLRRRGQPRDRSKLASASASASAGASASASLGRGPQASADDDLVAHAFVLDARLTVEAQLESALQVLALPAGAHQTVLG